MPNVKELTSEQLAARYGVKIKTVWVWQTRGSGPKSRKRRNRLFFREADVVAWEKETGREPVA